MKKLLMMVMCSFMMVGALAGCSKESDGNTGDTIKIGLNYAQSGGAATYGQDHIDGIKMAFDEINANGGINGRKVELVVKDNKTDPTEVVSVATAMIDEDGVVAILGPETSDSSASGIQVGNKMKVPVLSASATRDDVTFNKDGSVTEYGFKLCYSDSYQGAALAKFAADKGMKKAVIFGDQSSSYAKGLAKAFKKQYKKDGGKVVAEESYQEKDTDFNAQLTKLKNVDFDVLFIPGYYTEAGMIVKQARAAGFEQMIIGPDGFDSTDFIKLAEEPNLNNVYFSTHFSRVDASTKVVDFVKAFKKEYDKEPGCFNALGYDLAYYVAGAIESCGDDVTSENIKKALEDTEAEFSGVTGSFTMSKDHTPKKAIKVVKLENGVQVSVEEAKAD